MKLFFGKMVASSAKWAAKTIGPVVWHLVKDEVVPIAREAAKEFVKAELQAQVKNIQEKNQ